MHGQTTTKVSAAVMSKSAVMREERREAGA